MSTAVAVLTLFVLAGCGSDERSAAQIARTCGDAGNACIKTCSSGGNYVPEPCKAACEKGRDLCTVATEAPCEAFRNGCNDGCGNQSCSGACDAGHHACTDD